MKRFKFGPEKLLKLRAYREREAKIEFGRAVGALTLIESKITALAEDRLQAAARRFAPANTAAEILSYERYIHRLDDLREKLLEEAALAELKVEEARGLYLEASRERKILDKLKEKQQREYRKALQGEETKIQDDISSSRMTRQRNY